MSINKDFIIIKLKKNFSNKDLHTFSYNTCVKKSFKFLSLVSKIEEVGVISTPIIKSYLKLCNEY